MKDITYINRSGRILVQLDNHEIKDTVGVNRLLRLYCKYMNEKLNKELDDAKVSEGEQ